MSHDLMSSYAAYTTPNAALKDLAATGVEDEAQSFSLGLSIGLTVTIASMVTVTNK
ncbi:hypothetical protein OG338_10590 [Streptomyces sp. NBC_00726]|uniref:hypothetical protein n=1 Tax=Streptomyces sp. NBC_00726 TaxID=2903674 RepID=UPI00386A1346